MTRKYGFRFKYSKDMFVECDNLEQDECEVSNLILLDAKEQEQEQEHSLASDCDKAQVTTVLGKRIRYKNYVRLPRVLKRDIRRQYPDMIANVMNAHDFNLFHSFFRTYSYGSVEFKLRDLPLTGIQQNDLFAKFFDSNMINEVDYRGYKWVFFCWHVLTTLNPDYIVRIRDAKLVCPVGSDKSKLVLDVSIEFTLMFDIQIVNFLFCLMNSTVDEHRNEQLCYPSTSDTSSNLSRTVVQNSLMDFSSLLQPPDPFRFYQQHAGASMPLLGTPQRMALGMQFTFNLNELKQIESIDTSRLSLISLLSL